jgi:cytochrome c biogenesis protein CcmG, thiol:disulfide interchange protein DsbE
MNRKTLLLISALALVIVLLAIGCGNTCPEIGKPAPDFSLKSTEDKTVTLSELKGNIVVVNFWATWCGPCQFETPFLQAAHKERSGKGVVILGIDVKEPAPMVRNFVNSKNVTFTVLLDSDAQVVQSYCVPNALPLTYFVNKDGILKARKVGAFANQAELMSILDSIK